MTRLCFLEQIDILHFSRKREFLLNLTFNTFEYEEAWNYNMDEDKLNKAISLLIYILTGIQIWTNWGFGRILLDLTNFHNLSKKKNGSFVINDIANIWI